MYVPIYEGVILTQLMLGGERYVSSGCVKEQCAVHNGMAARCKYELNMEASALGASESITLDLVSETGTSTWLRLPVIARSLFEELFVTVLTR